MALRVASSAERSGVVSAVSEFRAHWSSYPSLWECPFAGTPDDIRALDYLNYEGLGQPESGPAGAALVWGNVLATSGPFLWYYDDSTGYLILSPGRDEPTVPCVWPYGRVCESEQGGPVTFKWLTAQVVAECLAWSGLDHMEETRIVALVDGHTRAEYSRRFEAAVERLRAQPVVSPNHDRLQLAHPDLQSAFKKPGGDTRPLSWATPLNVLGSGPRIPVMALCLHCEKLREARTRNAMLVVEGLVDRKRWQEDRLNELP